MTSFVKQKSEKIYEKQVDGKTIPVITPEVILTITHLSLIHI